MNQLSTPIKTFVKEFKLNHPDKGVCFDANVYVYTEKLLAIIKSEVQIDTVETYDIGKVYLLNPRFEEQGFPSVFEFGHVDFSFNPKYGLVINGTAPEINNYQILIQPENKDCKEPTLAEIHAKTNN